MRAREDCRGDLMRARHRLSKLLLRQASCTPAGRRGPVRTTRGCAGSASSRPATRLAFESDYEAVLTVKARRDRLDAAIAAMAADSEFTPVVHRLGCLRGVSTLTGFALAVEIGDWHRFTGTTIGAFVGLVPTEHSSGRPGSRGRSPRPATATPAGSSSRPPGTTASPYVAGKTMRDRWELAPPPRPGPAAMRATGGCTTAGSVHRPARNGTSSPTSRSPGSWPAGAGPWPSWTTDHPRARFVDAARLTAARGTTRDTPMSSRQSRPWDTATLDPRHSGPVPAEHTVLRYPTRAYQLGGVLSAAPWTRENGLVVRLPRSGLVRRSPYISLGIGAADRNCGLVPRARESDSSALQAPPDDVG